MKEDEEEGKEEVVEYWLIDWVIDRDMQFPRFQKAGWAWKDGSWRDGANAYLTLPYT